LPIFLISFIGTVVTLWLTFSSCLGDYDRCFRKANSSGGTSSSELSVVEDSRPADNCPDLSLPRSDLEEAVQPEAAQEE